jgi:phosphoglycerate dehydrogenase-like enzyme
MVADDGTRVLITGTTFITPAHESRLADSSITITRLENPTASEAELISAVQGVDGYILGGLERITTPVVEAADKLRAICFTGAGWMEFIPGHEAATRRGIAITAAPGANAQAVAELAVGLIHDRVRNISFLAGAGSGERIRGRQFRGLTIGIVGAGNIGTKVGRLLNGMYGSKIIYSSPRRDLDFEFATGAILMSLDEVLKISDVVSLHMRKTPETTLLIDANALAKIKDGGILVNTSFADAIDPDALFAELVRGRINVALDVQFSHVVDPLPDFKSISSRYLLQMGVQSGFGTVETVAIASDIATQAMIDLLTGLGDPATLVNPSYKSFR